MDRVKRKAQKKKMDLKMGIDVTPSENPCAKCKKEISSQPTVEPPYWIRNNMAQWYQVCTNFGSIDPDKQQAAYKDLVALNIRYANDIPGGMKCTLNFLKVRLQDKMFEAQIIQNQLADEVDVLKDMYVSAIKEFMDILGSTGYISNGIYPLTRKFQLPHLVDEVYHDICHREKKPILPKLRAAAHMCIDWLRDKFWINESKKALMWMEMEIKVKDDFREMVTALNKYLGHYFEGNRAIGRISDESLRRHVKERCNEYYGWELKKMKQRLIRKKLLENADISISIIVLVKDITEYLKLDRCVHMSENLAEVLLEGHCFLPSKKLMSTLDPTRYDIDQDLPFHFLKIWNGIFEFFPQRKFIPALIEKLLELTKNEKESEERRGMAAIWIKTLADSLIAVRDTLHLVTHKVISGKLERNKIQIAFERKLRQKVANSENMICLRPQEVPTQLKKSSNLERLLLPSPNKWTGIYLQSMMLLLEPRLPKQAEIMINDLVRIYTSELREHKFSYENITVYSVEDLKTAWKQFSKYRDVDDGDNKHRGIPWVRDVQKWGSNPSHHQLKILTGDLPGTSLWNW